MVKQMYLLTQKEYDEYIKLRSSFSKRRRMSKYQKVVYDYFLSHPNTTYVEAGKALCMNPSAIHGHICRLEKLGYVERDAGGKVYKFKLL